MSEKIICLIGPTASGKSQCAINLAKRYSLDIISVDSALVYCGLDIGTAKPSADCLAQIPHHLIDVADPIEIYNAQRFCEDAEKIIHALLKAQKRFILVGGTMMYFKALQQGLANMPAADLNLRRELLEQANRFGWSHLHERLYSLDPSSAARIKPTDQQRIQRALEVNLLTGKTMEDLWEKSEEPHTHYDFINLAIMPPDRSALHDQITKRFDQMLKAGFLEEAKALFDRHDVHPDLPALRAVGYRQAGLYLKGHINYKEMRERAIIATRQLAKRQMTWLRSWPECQLFPDTKSLEQAAINYLKNSTI